MKWQNKAVSESYLYLDSNINFAAIESINMHLNRYSSTRWAPSLMVQLVQLTTYLAIKTMQHLASDEGDCFLDAKDIIMLNSFLDDIIAGSNTKQEASLLPKSSLFNEKGRFRVT